jgi:hypothetical protein
MFMLIGIGEVKTAHILEVASRRAIAEFCGEAFCQLFEYLLAIFCTGGSALPLFHDPPADLVIGVNLQEIDATGGRPAGRED